MNVIKEKIDTRVKQLESMADLSTQDQILINYEVSFLQKILDMIDTPSLTASTDPKLNEIKREGLKNVLGWIIDDLK